MQAANYNKVKAGAVRMEFLRKFPSRRYPLRLVLVFGLAIVICYLYYIRSAFGYELRQGTLHFWVSGAAWRRKSLEFAFFLILYPIVGFLAVGICTLSDNLEKRKMRKKWFPGNAGSPRA